MDEQIQAWLDMIPPEERKRWSWLLDQNTTAFGNPRMVDTPVGRVWNPTSYPSDLLSGLNTAVREPAKEHAVQPVLGALTYASQLLPSTRPDLGRRKFFSDEAEAPLQGTDFGRYWRENKPTEGIPGFMADTIEDPLSLVGGPLGEAARGLAAVPWLARIPGVLPVLRGAAAADEGYQAAAGAVVSAPFKGAAAGLKMIPGVRPWLEASPQKALAQFGGRLARAVDDPVAADRVEKLVSGDALGLTGRAADWEGTIRPGFEAIDTAIGEAEHPLQQALLVQQRSKALELENLLEARFEQHRMALEEGRLAGEISDREFFKERGDLWKLQARATRALQLGLLDSIEAVKGHGAEALATATDAAGTGAAAPTLFDVFGKVGDDAVQSETLRTALRRASDEALAARDMGTAITGGTSGGEFPERVQGLFSMGMGEQGERIAGLQAQDPFYRQAREKAMAGLDEAAQAVLERYKDVVNPADVAGMDDAMRSAFTSAEHELAPFTMTPEQALAGLGESKRNAILSVWDTDSAVSLPKQLQRVLAARRGLVNQVSPALHDWYRTMGYDLAERNAAVAEALTSADRLLREPALLAPEAASLRASVIDRLNRFGHSGDILAPGDGLKTAANLTVSAYARSLGIKAPHPLLGAAITQLGAWKEQAVLSPAFQLANLIGGLVLGEAGGVSGTRVLNLLRHTLPQMKGVILRGEPIDLVFDGASSRAFSAIYGDANGLIRVPEELLGRRGGSAIDAAGGAAVGPAATNSGRIPLALRAGVPALSTGGSYWASNPDDPNRTQNALLVGGVAGAFGASTPHFVFYNQNLSQASEGAMRGAALFTGFEERLGSVKTGGIAKDFHDNTIEAIIGKPLQATSVGKELTRSDMLPGLNTVTGMQTLSDVLPRPKGIDVPVPGEPAPVLPPLGEGAPPLIEVAPPDQRSSRVVGLHRTGPSPVATAGAGVDVDGIKADFAAVNGWMSADALEQSALRHGATAEQAANLRGAWDEAAGSAVTSGINLSSTIHFDYSDINRLTAAARDTGVAPFITWQTKALPRFATLLLQNPRYLVAIDALNTMSDADIEEAGLTSRYARLAKMGVLGDFLANQILGRAGGTVLGAPLKALFPYSDVGREDTLPENANPLERALAELRPLGISPGPVLSLPLMATGATSELPVDLYGTSRYLRALSTGLTGHEADPELLTKNLMRAARGATGASVQPTVTGDFLKDRAIRQRIAEIAVEETGKPPAGPYSIAMDDPASQIWLRAKREVERQRLGETALGATVPFRTKYLSDTEAEIRRIREATGVGPTESAARRARPATAEELAAAEMDTRRKPLKPGETLEERAATARWIAAENAAASVDPLARALNNLGGDQAVSRAFPEWLAFQRRVRHMNPKRRGQLTAEFLGQRPALRKYIAETNIYG